MSSYLVCQKCGAHLDSMSDELHHSDSDCINVLREDNERLREIIADYKNGFAKTIDDKCPTDERHCGCVPILRVAASNYQKALVLITTLTELSEVKIIAEQALNETGKDSWREKSIGEYWAGQLEMLQIKYDQLEDKFDTLEEDYEDVCKLRLEAADSFSKQIIKLENDLRELREKHRWIPLTEKFPEDNQRILVLIDGTEKIGVYSSVWNQLSTDDGLYYHNISYSMVTGWQPLPELPDVSRCREEESEK